MKRFLILVITLYLIFLNAFFNNFNDESDWTSAGKSFLAALLKLSPSDTYVGTISTHPGVTVLWISAALQLLFPDAAYQNLLILHRLIFLILGSLLAFILTKLLINWFKPVTVIVILLYLLLDSHFIVSGNLSWLDLILTFLIPICILTWLNFLENRRYQNLLMTGILMGLSILTKFMGVYLLIVLPVITFIYKGGGKSYLSNQTKYLLQVFIIALVTFILLYPAMWSDPKRVLFSRFDPNEGGHQLSILGNSKLITSYPGEFAKVSPVIPMGIILLVIELFIAYKNKKPLTLPNLIGVGGLVYIFCLLATIQILVDKGRTDTIFLYAIGRYLLPTIPLVGVFFFYKLFVTKLLRIELKLLVIFILFLQEIYRMLYA